jgi:hypothetical protein
MDCVILLHFGGSVSDQFELVGMRLHVLTFEKLSSFNELVARVRSVMNIECDLMLHEGQQTNLCDITFMVQI